MSHHSLNVSWQELKISMTNMFSYTYFHSFLWISAFGEHTCLCAFMCLNVNEYMKYTLFCGRTVLCEWCLIYYTVSYFQRKKKTLLTLLHFLFMFHFEYILLLFWFWSQVFKHHEWWHFFPLKLWVSEWQKWQESQSTWKQVTVPHCH